MQDLQTTTHAAETPNSSSPPANGLARVSVLLRGSIARLKNRVKLPKPRRSWSQRFSQLSYSQWLYFIAIVCLILSSDGEDFEDNEVLLVGVIAGIGLAREIWHVIHTIWHTTLGKSVFLVLYAATANFALALAALKVNQIAGIEPTPLKFTLGFTTLIMLPLWIFVASIMFSILLLLFGVIWQAISLPLRLIRIKLPVHWEDRSFIALSMVFRLILIPVVISSLYILIKPYAAQLYVLDTPIKITRTKMAPGEEFAEFQALQGATDEERAAVMAELQAKGLIEVDNYGGEEAAEDIEPGVIDRMIAGFVYQFETYPNSSCFKQSDERVLTINEQSMLVAKRDESPLGFAFSVRACEPYYPEPASAVEENQAPQTPAQN